MDRLSHEKSARDEIQLQLSHLKENLKKINKSTCQTRKPRLSEFSNRRSQNKSSGSSDKSDDSNGCND